MGEKVGLIGDLHLGIKKNSNIFLKSQVKFLIKEFVSYLKNNNIKTVIMLGDIFDSRHSVNTKIQNVVFDFFDKYMKDFKVYVIKGNHDIYYNSSTDVSSLKFLTKFDNVTVVEDIIETEIAGKKVCMVPWVVNMSDFVNKFTKHSELCFGHFDITGFNMNRNRLSKDGIPADFFGSRCKKLFSGHFHTRSHQIIKGCEIVYAGSPYQLTRHDIGEERGFVVLDMDDYSYEHINNKSSIKYISLNFPEEFSKKTIKGNIIDVYISYSDSYKEGKIENYLKKIEEYEPAVSPNTVLVNDSSMNSNLNADDYKVGSMIDLMKDYVNSLDIKNKDQIYNILLDLYSNTKGDL